MRIYLAGPYSKGDVIANVRRAIRTADAISDLGHTVFLPHLTHFWDRLCPHEYEWWLDYDMRWLELCEAVFRMSGESSGADKEVAMAIELGMPVYYSIEELR